jgi:peptidyl-prolyl cis-trans isomerase C
MYRVIAAAAAFGSLLICAPARGESSPVLARVGGEKITLEDFSKQNPALASWFGMGAKSEQAQSALEGMVFQSVLAREARRKGLEDEPEVARQIERVLAGALLKGEMTPDRLAAGDSDLRRYYQEHREEYRDPAVVGVAHILVSTQGEANSIEKALKAGEPFEALARANSVDTASSRLGGSLGVIPPEALTPELREAVERLKAGEVSGVVKSRFGFHLVKVTSKPAASYKPYEKVSSEINTKVTQEKRQKIVERLKQKLWKEYEVEFDQAKLQELVKGPQAGGAHGPVVTGAEPAAPGTQPRLRLLSEAYDLGKLSMKPVIHSSLLVNEGDSDVLIRGVSSQCECLTGEIKPARLAPGQVGRLTVTFNPSLLTQAGPAVKVLIIDSNDVDRPQRYVRYAADLIKKK